MYNAPPDKAWLQLALPPVEALEWMANLRRCAMAGVVVHDEDSTGRVTASRIEYSLGDHDRSVLFDALGTAARVYFAAGASAVVTGLHGPGTIAAGQYLDHALKDETSPWQMGLYAAHPMGTCRMDRSSTDSVVDADGRVWGWDNRHAADTRVFPTSLGVNPQVTTYAVGLTVGAAVADRAG